MATHYEVLNVAQDASHDEIRRAYHDQARRWHPDRFVERSAPDSAVADATMRLVNDAWRVLGDARSRATYDATLRVAAQAPTQPASAPAQAGPIRIDPRLLDPDYLRDRARAQDDAISDQHARVLRLAPWLGLAFLLIGIFVFTAYASRPTGNASPGTIPGPPIPFAASSCIRVLSEGLQEVPGCNGTNDGRIIGARLEDGVCPAETTREVPYRQVWICLLS